MSQTHNGLSAATTALTINIQRRYLLLTLLISAILLFASGCSDEPDNVALHSSEPPTLKSLADFPIGNIIYLEDDHRFTQHTDTYDAVLDIIRQEVDYVGHDELFRIRETHPGPLSSNYSRLDDFIDFAEGEGFRIHGHNLLFYSDVGPDSWIAQYRRDNTWTQAQWRDWFEQYIKEKVGRYRGRVHAWDVLNEPLARVVLDEFEARNIFIDLAGEDIYAKAFQWAREADPDTTLVLNEFFLGPGALEKTDALIALADEISRGGGKVDVLGFEGIYFFAPLLYTSYSYNYERFKKAADAGYGVTLSELNVALNVFPAAGRHQAQTRLLHTMQRKAFNNVIRAYMDAVPPAQRWGVVTWGAPDYYGFTRFGDLFKTFRAAGGGSEWPLLWNDDLMKKPAYFGFANALQSERELFKYTSVFDGTDLDDSAALSSDAKAELLVVLDEERAAAATIPAAGEPESRFYEEVRREIDELSE